MTFRNASKNQPDGDRYYTSPPPSTIEPPMEYYSGYKHENDLKSEYMQVLRNRTNTELQSITERVFQVLNDYEDATAKDSSDCITDIEIDNMDNSSLKDNIQRMITDYKEHCSERESLLYSLQEWFEQQEVDDEDRYDIDRRRLSVKKSIEEGKNMSERLKLLQERMKLAREEDLAFYKQEKQRLEGELSQSKRDLEKAKLLIDEDNVFVTNTWKHAAMDIRNMLKLVRENGLNDINEMEEKLQTMADVLTAQDEKMIMLNRELADHRKKLKQTEHEASELSDENTFLLDEVDHIRTDLYESRKKMARVSKQHSFIKRKQEETTKCQEDVTKESEEQIALLTKENQILKQELAGLKLMLQSYSTKKVRKDSVKITNSKKSSINKTASSLYDEQDVMKFYRTKLAEMKQKEEEMSRKYTDSEIDRIIEQRDVLIQDKQNEIEQLREQLRLLTGRSDELDNKITITINENTVLKDTIETLEAKIGGRNRNNSVNTLPVDKMENTGDIESNEQFRQNGNQNRNQPQQNGNQSHQNRKQSSKNRRQSSVNRRQSSVNRRQSSVNGNQSYQNGNQSYRKGNQPHQNGNQSYRNENQPHQNGNQHHQNENQSLPDGSRLFTMIDPPQLPQDTPDTTVEVINETDLEEFSSFDPITDPSMVQPMASGDTPLNNAATNQGAFSLANPGYSDHATEQPTEAHVENTNVTAFDIVTDLMRQLNEDRVQDYADKDSLAMNGIQTEMDKVVQMIQTFVTKSLNLVDNEVDSMNEATKHLLGNLTEREKYEAERKVYEELQDTHHDQKHLKERVMKLSENAIKVLKAGEEVVQSHVKTQQRKLSYVVSVMAEHKKKQSKTFMFSLPDNNNEVLSVEARGIPTDDSRQTTIPKPQQQQQQQQQHTDHKRINTTQYTNAADRIRAILRLAEGNKQADRDELSDGIGGVYGVAELQINNSKRPITAILPHNKRHGNSTPVRNHAVTASNPSRPTIPKRGPVIFDPFQNSSLQSQKHNGNKAPLPGNRKFQRSQRDKVSKPQHGTTTFLDLASSVITGRRDYRTVPAAGGLGVLGHYYK